MKQYLTEAFKQMELIESNEFTYDADGAAELANFMEKDMLDDFEAIIDPEAETVEDLKDSYIGDVICECQVCKSKLFKSPEDIKIEEGEELANIGEPCPYCFETDGFKVIGQVAPFEEITVETDGSSDVKVEVDGEQIDTNTDDDEPTARHAKDNEDLEDSQRFPVEGTKQIDLTEKKERKSKRHAKDNEDLEDSQRYPIKSPVGTKGLKESKEDDKSLQDKIYDLGITIKDVEAVKDWLAQGSTIDNRAKIQAVYTDVDFELDETEINKARAWQKSKPTLMNEISMIAPDGDLDALIAEMKKLGLTESISKERWNIGSNKQSFNTARTKQVKEGTEEETEQDRKVKLARRMRLARHKKDNEDLEDSQRYPIKSPAPAQTGLAMMEGMLLRDKLKAAFPGVFNFEDRKEESLKEGMEDISITTDDQVIKVKATPRADKEAIQPVSDETKDVIESDATEEPIPVEEIPETEEDVEITDFDEEAFDELGESYLKRVYDNVSSFRTTDGSISGNKLILEGVITFNSGKSAKTKFVFESKTITKSGKVKLKGLNEHISSNKNSFTLTGTIKGTKLLSESLNYNYGARSDAGKMKRLYGTVKRNIK